MYYNATNATEIVRFYMTIVKLENMQSRLNHTLKENLKRLREKGDLRTGINRFYALLSCFNANNDEF